VADLFLRPVLPIPIAIWYTNDRMAGPTIVEFEPSKVFEECWKTGGVFKLDVSSGEEVGAEGLHPNACWDRAGWFGARGEENGWFRVCEEEEPAWFEEAFDLAEEGGVIRYHRNRIPSVDDIKITILKHKTLLEIVEII